MECLVYIHGVSSLHPRYADCTRVACGVRPRDVIRQKCKLLHVSPRFPAKKRVFPAFFPHFSTQKIPFSQKTGDQNYCRKKFKSIALFWPISPYNETHSSICRKKNRTFLHFSKKWYEKKSMKEAEIEKISYIQSCRLRNFSYWVSSQNWKKLKIAKVIGEKSGKRQKTSIFGLYPAFTAKWGVF